MSEQTKLVAVGETYGRWTVLGPVVVQRGRAKWLVRCSCPDRTEREVLENNLKRGISTSCGCHQRQRASEESKKHGLTNHALFRTWAQMIQRCTNAGLKEYLPYGGRGISVCERWRTSFPNFLADMGPKPSPKHTLDRIDNNGNYEPGNCRWATLAEQAVNKRTTRRVTIGGESLRIPEWCERIGISRATFYHRLYDGWTEIDALTTPAWGRGSSTASRMGGKIPERKRMALELLCQGVAPAEVARKVGVARETIWRWKKALDG